MNAQYSHINTFPFNFFFISDQNFSRFSNSKNQLKMQNIYRIIVVLCTVSAMTCATLPTDSLAASIDEVQKKFGAVAAEKRVISTRKADAGENNKITDLNDSEKIATNDFSQNVRTKEKSRNDKMLDFYRYFSPTPSYAPMPYVPYYPQYYQQPYMSAFYSPYYPGPMVDPNQNAEEYDEEYTDSNDVDDSDDGSRANKRRPASKNSPIFYIRLPPTPYMFVPGMGYISQPPTIQPLTPQYPINPFINLPLTYLSNAKPTGVFPWNPQASTNYAGPQFPSYLPPRPQKPYRPKPQIPPGSAAAAAALQGPAQDSKITHLGSYLFNGRPESIYLMPPYHNPYASPYAPSPYNSSPYNPYQAAAPIAPTPYNPYSPIYAPPPALPNYY